MIPETQVYLKRRCFFIACDQALKSDQGNGLSWCMRTCIMSHASRVVVCGSSRLGLQEVPNQAQGGITAQRQGCLNDTHVQQLTCISIDCCLLCATRQRSKHKLCTSIIPERKFVEEFQLVLLLLL